MDTNTLAGLIEKRRELARKIEHHQRVLNELIWGEMQRFVLGALRAATEPVKSLEIPIEVVKGRGLDPNDPRDVGLIRKRVRACRFHLKAKGLAQDVATTGPYKGWERV